MIAQLLAENADLRRQLAEAQAEIAAWVAMRDAANAAIAEAAELRRQLAVAQSWSRLQTSIVSAVPRDAIADLYTAYAYATAGSEVHARFPAVGRWLGLLPGIDDADDDSRAMGEGE